jgi:hypothetical protein
MTSATATLFDIPRYARNVSVESCTTEGVRIELWQQEIDPACYGRARVAIGLAVHVGGSSFADFTPAQLHEFIADLTEAARHLDSLGPTDDEGILR